MNLALHRSRELSWASASRELLREEPRHALALYRGAAPPWAMNGFKGSFGERLLSRSITAGVFETDSGRWAAITPHRSGGAGIDQLFVRLDGDGRPVSLIVAEAKFGHSRLGETTAGLQMSDAWTRPRLAATARDYARAADALRAHGSGRAALHGARALAVPVPGFGTALVVVEDERVSVRCRGGAPPASLVERQLRRTSRFLAEASTGQRSYRPRLLRIASRGHAFDVKLDVLDGAGGMTGQRTRILGEGHELPFGQRNLLRQALAATFREHGVNEEHIEALTEAAFEDPALLSAMHLQPEASWRVGLDAGLARAARTGAILAAATIAYKQWRASGTLDWKRLIKVSALSGANAALGYYAGVQIHVRLVTTEIGARLMSSLPLRASNGSVVAAYGSLGGAVATSVFFAVGAYWLGLVDAREAKILGASGIAGATASTLFTSGAFGAAAIFGTAGTGTALSTLSGAAFTHAALAWLGGGAIAVGGGGMVVGAAILSGGTVVVAAVASAGVRWGAKKLREREQRLLVQGRISLVRELLAATRA